MTCFSAIAVSGCSTKRVVTNLKPPETRLECQGTSARPQIPPEHTIDWSKVRSVSQARTEHDKYVAAIRSREGVIVGYIVHIEGKLFTCANNAAWLRQWYAATGE